MRKYMTFFRPEESSCNNKVVAIMGQLYGKVPR